MSLPFLRSLLRDRFLHLLILIGAALCFVVPFHLRNWPASIDWHTIVTLSGLLLLTKGVELSGYFDVLGCKLVRRFTTERGLACFMVLASSALSTFLTNDVALFIVVPLTLTLKKWCVLPINRLIIFEALAVNAGSLLTPIGNPQNILLWGRSGISFPDFIGQMAPLTLAMMLSLLLLCRACFTSAPLNFQGSYSLPAWKPKLVWICLFFYLVFLLALDLHLAPWGLAALAVGFLLFERQVIIRVDWTLLLVFMVMFIDVHLLTQLPAFHHALMHVGQLPQAGQWLTAVGLSQIISNVPATILLINYVPPSVMLAWAVNVGGFGLLPGSLANLIALRMANDSRIWWRFHLYSIPMLLWAMAVGYGLLCLLY